jgi:hypothetical protein
MIVYDQCKRDFVNSGLKNTEIILIENLINNINNFNYLVKDLEVSSAEY